MDITPWSNRKFNYSNSQHTLAVTMERLAGTPLRLIDKLSRIPEELLVQQSSLGKWSMQEQAGHLLDMESVWMQQLEGILAQTTCLQAHDYSNQQTTATQYNTLELEDILVNFTLFRRQIVDTIATLSKEQLQLSVLHPDLKQQINIEQLALFIADHDDHHLACITRLMVNN